MNPFFVSSTFKALRFLNRNKPLEYTDEQIKNITKDIRDNYITNARIVKGLATEYNFTPIFLWQPLLFTKQSLSEYESKNVNKYAHKSFAEVGNYTDTSLFEHNIESFYDLTDIFNDYNETIFVDYVHVSVKGNEIIAENVAEILVDLLNEQKAINNSLGAMES